MIFVRNLINMLPATFYAGALLISIVLFSFQSCALDDAKSDLAVANANLDTAVATNRRNSRAIDTIKLINEQCLDDRRADETRHANARAAWASERNTLEVEANAARQIETIEVYRTPSCVELAQLDINDVCPDLANSLRERTARSNRIRNGGSGSSGTDPDR